jgi:hypothetical protein
MSALGNRIDPGNDRVIGAHLMNMEHDDDLGLRQETVYDRYPAAVQKRQVKYVGIYLANVLKQRMLAEAYVTITDDWTDLEKKIRPTDYRFTRKETHRLVALHPQERMPGLLHFWHNYHKNNECEWLVQPNLDYEGAIAWLMPTRHPAILYRPGHRDSCVRFLQTYVWSLDTGLIKPEDWNFPDIPV